jgi:hypothetical protein
LPLTIPAFDQYQSPLVPLRGLWNTVPPEGDRYVNAEIDWLVTTKSNAVQFSLSGNSPVTLSQIAALVVDNSRSGADCDFVFPDSGFVLTVPAHNQVVTPVFTNALMFYAVASGAIAGDVTILQILNSIPPPIPIAPSSAQNHAAVTGVNPVNGSTQLIPAGVNGTLNVLSMTVGIAAPANFNLNVSLIDGAGHTVWINNFGGSAVPAEFEVNLASLSVRFVNGLALVVNFSTATTGSIVANAYYSTP